MGTVVASGLWCKVNEIIYEIYFSVCRIAELFLFVEIPEFHNAPHITVQLKATEEKMSAIIYSVM